ncbi:MAG: M48 family metalloprotease [Saprospiraceae bacterium]
MALIKRFSSSKGFLSGTVSVRTNNDDISKVPYLTREHLLSWYHLSIKSNQEKSKLLRKDLRFVFGYLSLSTILIFSNTFYSIFIVDKEESTTNFFFVGFFLVGLILFIYLVRLYLFVKRGMSTFQRNVENKNFLPLSNLEGEFMEKLFMKLANDMNIDFERVVFWRSSSKTYLPSIVESKKLINVVLPMNFFLLCVKNPDEVKALMAHEFGHVLQNDTNLWLFVEVFSKGMKKFFYKAVKGIFDSSYYSAIASPFIIIILLLMDKNPNYLNQFGTLIINLLIILLLYRLVKILKKAPNQVKVSRRKSEELADTASILFANGLAMEDVLKKYARDSDDEMIHPKRAERVRVIMDKLRKYQIVINRKSF